MNLYEQILSDLTSAMKEKNKDKLSALRAVKAQILLIQTSGSGKGEISDDEIIKLLQKMIKQRKDSAEIYKTQNRVDLFETEMNEVNHLQAYLPKQLSEEELTAEIKQIIVELGVSSIKEMGKVIGYASKSLAGKSEGKLIAETVKKMLS
jgi:uncharacterized protein YqeY